MKDTLGAMREFVLNRHAGELTQTLIPRTDIYRVTYPMDLPPEIYPPFVSLILQGEKHLQTGARIVSYSAGQVFIAALDMPAMGKIAAASEAAPYLAVRLTLDFALISELIHAMPAVSDIPLEESISVDLAGEALLDAWLRLLRLMDHPEDVAVMAPLAEREVLYRLLRGPQGSMLRQAADVSSHFSVLRRPVSWLRTHYAQPVRVNDLAGMANMSLSVFHRRFKAGTGLTPLQYQKHLRLYAARKLLFLREGNVADVAATVGYESLTQFTREYARMFGNPPARDSRNQRL